MSKFKNGGLDQYGTGPPNSSNLEQLALKGLSRVSYDAVLKVKVRTLKSHETDRKYSTTEKQITLIRPISCDIGLTVDEMESRTWSVS